MGRIAMDRAANAAGMAAAGVFLGAFTIDSAGANAKAVRKMLGHASAAMTLDVYADLFDDDLDDVATRLDQALMISSVAKMWPNADRPGTSKASGRSKNPGNPGQ